MAFKRIYDSGFKYRNAASTDIRLTFQRVRRQLETERQILQNSSKIIGRIVPQVSDACVAPNTSGKAGAAQPSTRQRSGG